jgi:hypothetical protein
MGCVAPGKKIDRRYLQENKVTSLGYHITKEYSVKKNAFSIPLKRVCHTVVKSTQASL